MRLEELCTVFTDGDWIESKDQSDQGIRLVQTGNIGEGVYLEKEAKAKYISEETFKKLKCTEIFPGDILVSRLPEPVGRACIIPKKQVRMITAVDCTICRPDESMISKEYLCYFMRSSIYYKRLYGNVTGTTRKRISRKSLGNVELDVPLREKQEIVVEQLDCLTKIIDSRKKELELLDKFIKARFVEMFGDPVQNDKDWETDTVEKICKEIYGGGTPSKSHSEYYENGDIPWVSPKDMKTDTLTDSQIKINKTGVENSTVRMVPANSVIMVIRSGILKHTLPVAINTVPITVNQDLKVFIPNERILTRFLAIQFKMHEKDILSGVRAVTADNIEFDSLKRRRLIIPPINLQREYCVYLDQVDKLIREQSASGQRKKQLTIF